MMGKEKSQTYEEDVGDVADIWIVWLSTLRLFLLFLKVNGLLLKQLL